jgi:FkbM family methyltransferase
MQTDIEAVGRFLGLKKAAASVLCSPLSGWLLSLVFGGRIPHRGARIEVPPRGDPRVAAALFWGTYESAEIRYVRAHLQGDLDVVELGSSLGGVSSEIARRLQPGRRLVCVEANPELLAILGRNLQRNAPQVQVQLVHGAISYDGQPEVEFAIGESNLSSHVGSNARARRVPAVTLGGVLAQAGLGEFALVSDIEGAEAGLFELDAPAMARCRLLIIELHDVHHAGNHHTPDTLITLIERRTGMRLLARYGEVCTFVR